MEIRRLSLYDRLERLNGGEAAHPEYDGAVIQSMAHMPIAQYLGDDAFYDLQRIMEVWGGWEYQFAAKAIAAQTRPPEAMSQILRLLAAPIIQIEEAYRQGKTSLLPYRELRRTTQRVESLASRLEGIGVLAGPPYNLHRMPIKRFFWGVSKLTGDLSFPTIYQDNIRPHAPDESTLFRQAVYDISATKTPERTGLLYKILIEPFAALQNAESELPI